jgi:hypothetical protein
MAAVDEIDFAVRRIIRRQEMVLALCTYNAIMADSRGIAVSIRNGIDSILGGSHVHKAMDFSIHLVLGRRLVGSWANTCSSKSR